MSFEYFCNEFGYDQDSRTAEKIYNSCIEAKEKACTVIEEGLYDFANTLNEQLN